ncbi:efflux RND transporter permease subunit [Paracidovorax wautersii]|uniref:Multidrug efflux pump n=1 Tax=Paracidovorax wautersii TaxID=1177982 RepID=A0ABU1I8B8_9BURK|nr:efflux RND transporter permease subunit [Paracidovorax wautersii]MDR6213464.1 multidrug efflux pump [Paracidovorax wautersii]
MNLARLSIRRPVGSCLLAVALVLLGLLAWRLLPVAPLPEVDFPVIKVSASLPGASPESMAATVAAPLERALGAIAGVQGLSSSSNQGTTQVTLEFALGRDLEAAARDVQAALNAVRGQLPAGMKSNPSFTKQQAAQRPIVVLALSSPHLPPSALYDAASTILAQRLSQVPGVAEVTVGGASLPAVRVQVDPAALAHQGVALDAVRTAIVRSSAVQPIGAIEDAGHRWQVAMDDAPMRAADFAPLVVRWVNGAAGQAGGAPVHLGDVARVSDSTENRYSSGFHNDKDAVIVQVRRQPGANVVATVDAVQAQLPYLRTLMPPDAQLDIVLERSQGIRASLAEAHFTLVLSIALVVAVVAAFLGRLRTALIPTVAIPVSLIGTFAVMYAAGFSLNNLSLMALIVAAGLVVDDAIVVLENVERYIDQGLPPLRAALRGAGEVGFTLVAMTLALVVVFISILFMGGIVERLFREFSLTLAAAVAISLLVSLTLTPVLCAYGLQARRKAGAVPLPARAGWVQRQSRAGALMRADVRRAYDRSLVWSLRHGALVLLVLAAVVGVNVWLYITLPKILLPRQDTGIVHAFIRGDDGFSFQIMQPKIEAYRRLILADPAVAHVAGTSGGIGSIANSFLLVSLKPLAERGGEPTQAVVNRLRAMAPAVPGGVLSPSIEQDIRIGVSFGEADSAVILRSGEVRGLRGWARKVSQALAQRPEFADVETVSDGGAQQVVVDIDREAARRLGVDMDTIAAVLNNSYSQRQVATLYDRLNQYRVVMEVDPRFTAQPQSLAQLQVIGAGGARVPLTAFATWRYGLADDQVYHDAMFASMYIGYNLAPGVTAEQGRQALDAVLSGVMLPSSVHVAPSREDAASARAVRGQPLLVLAVVLAVYLVLGVLYESTLHPLTILSTVPPASVGALLALWLTDTPFSLMALLGLFLLIGVVMKNAILMIDFALAAQRREGLPPHEAIRRAAGLRLRPILMTNLAGLLGALPLVLGTGEGAELRRPLGLAIVGGLAVSQLLTLYTTPVVYHYLERWRQRWVRPGHDGPLLAPAAAVHS